MQGVGHLGAVRVVAPANHLHALGTAQHGPASHQRRYNPMSVARHPPPALHVPPASLPPCAAVTMSRRRSRACDIDGIPRGLGGMAYTPERHGAERGVVSSSGAQREPPPEEVPHLRHTAMQKLRIERLVGFGTGRQKTVLERGTTPKLSRRTCSLQYGLQFRIEGNRRAPRYGPVGDLPPEISHVTIRNFLHRCTVAQWGSPWADTAGPWCGCAPAAAGSLAASHALPSHPPPQLARRP
jgi:hypothetical protein